MKKIRLFLGLFFLILLSFSAIAQTQMHKDKNGYSYQTVANDPMNAQIYTLQNGLKVYFTINKNEPRIQTYIAVRVGSKNDPKENTGLAHYFEHLMFKGTQSIGTKDWQKESILLDQIENLYEVYIKEKDKEKRDNIYKMIDAYSYEASKLAIANEYVKLMKQIGASGTNAATSNDYTFYQENIPSNQVENWARIQADRFTNPVIRLFHTELETVYEEKNMSLTNDARKANEAMLSALYPNHPYGTQTTLGDAEHLRNPSIKKIKEFFDKYYVPNNYCIILAGDFNPEEAIVTIDKYFGKIPSKPIEEFSFEYEKPITSIITKDVVGLEAENTRIAYRINKGQVSKEAMYVELIARVLSNRKCGLIDENINKKQLTMGASAYMYGMNDYISLVLSATPKKGQSLEQARELLLEQIEIFKKGDWDESLLQAVINNYRLQNIKSLENNGSRANMIMYSYLANQSWEDAVKELDDLASITKKELVEFANKNFLSNNYIIVNKIQGTPKEIAKVEKPAITPIHMEREAESALLKEIKETKVIPIEPVFVDYNKDIKRSKLNNGAEILYVENKENKTFELTYLYNYGELNNKRLDIATNYINFLGTSTKTSEQISREFYNLACNYSFRSSSDRSSISLSGLSENMPKAISLLEELINDAQADKEALSNLIANIIKGRNDAKANQQRCLTALGTYALYGKENPQTDILSEKELLEITPEQLIADIKELNKYSHRILFYGDMPLNDLKALLDKEHKTTNKLTKAPKVKYFEPKETEKNVYFVHYDAKQSFCRGLTRGGKYDATITPSVNLYNSYFGGSMSSIVFQEMREKRSLAYTAQASYISPSKKDDYYINMSHIATQNDKVIDAINAFNELFDQMPVSTQSFDLAKEGLISSLRTQRTLKMGIINSFLASEELGLKTNISKTLFEKMPTMTINDVVKFNEKYIKNQPRTYIVLGNKDQVNLKDLEKFGKITTLSLEEIFGY